MKFPFLRLLVLTLASLAAGSFGRADELYRFLREIPIGGAAGWDYLSVDPVHHRLYVTHATEIVVIDTENDAVLGQIANTPGVHGFALAPELGRGFSSNGRENKVGVIELASLKTLFKVDTGQNPDAILFEPGRREVYAFNGRSQSATVMAADTGRVLATIPLGGKPEFAQADSGARRVFDNLEDKNEVAVIDTETHAVVTRWPIAPGEEASGLDIDRVHHRLFLGCGNEKLVVLDSTDGHVVASLPAGRGIDAAVFDPGTQLAFTSNGRDGTVTVVREDTPDRYTVAQTLETEVGARTMMVDPASHRLYLVTARFLPVQKGRRPRPVAGSMKVLVYGPGEALTR